MRDEIAPYIGAIVKFSGIIKMFRSTGSINMDNNIIDDTTKQNPHILIRSYNPKSHFMLRYMAFRTLLVDVTVEPIKEINDYGIVNNYIKLDHIWIIYDLRHLGYELNSHTRNHYGKVMKYKRADNSIDYGIYLIE